MGEALDRYTKLERKCLRLEDDNRYLRGMAKKINRRGFGFDDFLEAYQKFVQLEKVAPLTYFPTQIERLRSHAAIPPIHPDHTEIAVLALSDWHLTETVRLQDSNGVNVYNSMIAANRLWDVVQSFKKIIRIHQAAYEIGKIWLPTLGDMISGSIHPEFLTTNDLTDQAAIILCARLLEMVVEELRSLEIPIQMDCVVGNHPRTTVKVPTKNLAHTNLDWVVYMILEMLYRDKPQVKVNVHLGQLAIVDHFKHRYVIEHGIDWKNGKEEDFEDAIRALLDDPVYRQATGMKGAAFDMVVIGNLHKSAFLERTIKNGALIGQNELGQQWRLKPIRAVQNMWGISQKHVKTFQYSLDSTEITSQRVENSFSEFTREFLRDHSRYQM